MRKRRATHDEKVRTGMRAGMSCWLALVVALLADPLWAADAIQQQMREVEAALARITQEQQSIYQQFQMVQELRRNDERQLLPLPTYSPPGTLPNYEDVKREDEARTQRIRQYQYELDRLHARYRELDQQRRPLLEQLAVLAQQRMKEEAAQRATPEQRGATTAR
jgi:hypothetical protein